MSPSDAWHPWGHAAWASGSHPSAWDFLLLLHLEVISGPRRPHRFPQSRAWFLGPKAVPLHPLFILAAPTGPCPCSAPAVAGLAVAVSQGTAGHWGAGEGAHMKGNWEQELGQGTVGSLPADLGGEHI